MTLFDLLFIAVVLASVVTLIAAAVTRSLRIVRGLAICAIAYLGVVAVVGLLSPRRVIDPGQPWCFDDWCLTVEGASRSAAPPLVAYHVSLRIFSRARRISQRAKGAWIYVIDRHGNRYAPDADPSAVPLDALLGPGESIATSRTFRVPPGAGELGLITGHGPSFISLVVIADEASLFHKRTYIQLPGP